MRQTAVPRPPAGPVPVVLCVRPGIAPVLERAGLGCAVVPFRPGTAPPPGHRADVVLGGNVAGEEVLPWAEGAGWVHLTGVGVDGVPPGLSAGRVVTYSPGANAVAAVLAFAKRLPEAWEPAPGPLRPDVLTGRTLGLAGYGTIARAVAERARAFGMAVLVHTRTPRPDTTGIRFVDRAELAARSDHLVLAASATPQTRHLVDAAFLARTRPGVHLVNVARGALVDQEALRGYLDSGHVARATLDVTDPEPLPAGHWLRHHPRARVSPHVAAGNPDSLREAVAVFAANYRRYLAGEELANVVEPSCPLR